jgi:type I restriction enzyme S subunit
MPVTTAKFLHLALTAAYLQLRASSEDAGSTKGAITCENLKRFKLAIPPLPEQDELLARIQAETRTLMDAISRLKREIALLREYRTRLVADVVTGKLDVREAASKLPAETLSDPAEVVADFGDDLDDLELIDEDAIA